MRIFDHLRANALISLCLKAGVEKTYVSTGTDKWEKVTDLFSLTVSGAAEQLSIGTRNCLPKNLIFPTRFRHGRILRALSAKATVRLSLQIQRCGFRSPVVNRRTAPRKRLFRVCARHGALRVSATSLAVVASLVTWR